MRRHKMKTTMRCAAVLFSIVLIAGCLSACSNNTEVEETETEAITEAETETETAEAAEVYEGIVNSLIVSVSEDGSLVFTWDETPDAVGYLVEVHDAEGGLIDSFTVREPEAVIEVPENGSYIVFVMRVLDIDSDEITDIDSFAEIEFTVEADETIGTAAVTTTGRTTANVGPQSTGTGSQTVAPSAANDPTGTTTDTPSNNTNTTGGNSGSTGNAGSGGANGSGTGSNTPSGNTQAGGNTGSTTPANTGNGSSGGNNNPTPAGGNSGSGNSGGNTSSSGNTTVPTQHQHTWVESQEVLEPAWDETICVSDAWDEEVYETHTICRGCGMDFTAAGWSQNQVSEHCSQHMLNGEPSNYGSSRILTGTIHHDAEYETIHHDAVINNYYVCSECGARG